MIPTGHYFIFYVVMCEECQCKTNEFPDKEMAVDAWNQRPEALAYKGYYRCPNCNTTNTIWEKRENTVENDTVYCWHCGTKVKLESKRPEKEKKSGR